MLRASGRPRCVYGSGLFGGADLRDLSDANEHEDQGCAVCVDGLGCIVRPLNSITDQIHLCCPSTAMCAVAKAITLKGIWSMDFTCKRCYLS